MRVLLASTSPARLALLRQAGIEPLTRAPGVDEEALIAEIEEGEHRRLPPEEHVLVLARAKAQDVAAAVRREDPGFEGIIIGGDSMFALDGEILGKPYEAAVATVRWERMRGRTGTLHSGHSIIVLRPGAEPEEASETAQASVTFAEDVSDEEIAWYVGTGEPLQVAGAFTLDSLAAPFITRIEGAPSTVIGMSLPALRTLAKRLGVAWTEITNLVG